MRDSRSIGWLIFGLLIVAGSVSADTPVLTLYGEMSSRYEAIRLTLLMDSVDGLTENAQAIRQQAAGFLEEPSAAAAGVPEENEGDLRTVVEEIEAAAEKLADASDLDAAREEFFGLTKPMARYRELVGDEDTVVAYCSMAQKAWIQPTGDLGNPYFGQQMARCGEIVAE